MVFTPPEATNTGPGFYRGSGGGARGCDSEERVGAYARTEGGRFLSRRCLAVLSLRTSFTMLLLKPMRSLATASKHTWALCRVASLVKDSATRTLT